MDCGLVIVIFQGFHHQWAQFIDKDFANTIGIKVRCVGGSKSYDYTVGMHFYCIYGMFFKLLPFKTTI